MRTIMICLLILVSSVFSLPAEIKNENKPSLGQWDFKLEKIWELDSAGDYPLVQVQSINVDNKGNLFLLEGKHFKFFVISPGGKYLYSFGNRGEGPGEYKFAFNFFLVNDAIIVPDQGKINYFKTNGEYVKSVNPGIMMFPREFIDENRFILVQDREDEKKTYEKVEIYDLNTNKRFTLAEVTAEKALNASSSSGGGQMVLRIKIGDTTPMVIAAVYDNVLYYGKNDNYLIKKTDFNANELLSFSLQGKERKKIPLEYKKKRIDQISLNGGKIPSELAEQIINSMPDYSTYFSNISIEENGLIYVYLNDAANETGQEIDIFSPQGKYLYHAITTLPEGLKRSGPIEIKGSYLYVFAEDEEGEGKLLKFKITKPTRQSFASGGSGPF